jgi:hypothetical protein
MAKNESTAVNELIHRVATMSPLRPDPADDLLFRAPPPRPKQLTSPSKQPAPPAHGNEVPPLPRTRSAHGTSVGAKTMKGLGPVVKKATAAAPPPPPRHQTTAPPSMPVAAPFEVGAMPSFGRAKPGSLTTGHAVAPVALEALGAPIRAWVEPAPARREPAPARVEPVPARREPGQHREEWVGTLYVRRSGWQASARKLVVPLVAVTVLGLVAGGYFAFHAGGGERAADASPSPVAAAPAAASKAPAAPQGAPAAEPAATAHGGLIAAGPALAEKPALAPAPAPASMPTPASFVDVMILSSPAGATVTLVDRDRTLLIGKTPVSTALDPSRTYELLFTHPSRPTWSEPIDPSQTRRVDVNLGPAEAKPMPVKAVAAPAGEGILMIASKPPCDIVIDGTPTGLTTPQREIPLRAGTHKVTLVNKAENINKTLSVRITADQSTKVIQDLMK